MAIKPPLQNQDAGFILIYVLWTLAFLALIASLLANNAKTNIKAQANLLHHVQAQTLADGLTHLVANDLLGTTKSINPNKQLRRDGTLSVCRIDNNLVHIKIIDVIGQVDLNTASVTLLNRLLLGVGTQPEQARKLARAVVDFRSGNVNATIKNAYRAAGLPHGPKNSPFQSISELDQVLGIAPDLYRRLRPMVTIYSMNTGIDPYKASLPLLRVLVGAIDTNTNQQIPDSVLRRSLPSQFRISSKSDTFSIRVAIFLPNGTNFIRTAVATRSQKSKLGFKFLDWSSPPDQHSDLAYTIKGIDRCSNLFY